MARYNSKDYIPSYSDIEAKHDAWAENAKAARERGFHLGEYEVTYKVNGHQLTEKVSACTAAEAVEGIKRSCGMVGWYPIDIQTKTLVEPNIYV